MIDRKRRLVFDCNVFAQSLINELSPASRCYCQARMGKATLFVSEDVLAEIFELHLKLPARYNVKLEDCQALLQDIQSFANYMETPAEVYAHPLDPCYVNLALEAKADLIVSRNKHLLGLTDPTREWSTGFRKQNPYLRVLTPDQYLLE